MEVNDFSAFYTSKMLVILGPTIKSARLPRSFDLKCHTNFSQGQ
jgi:hypothetical protein